MVKEIKCITKVQQYYMRTRLPDWFTACSHLCNIEIRAAVVEDRDVFSENDRVSGVFPEQSVRLIFLDKKIQHSRLMYTWSPILSTY